MNRFNGLFSLALVLIFLGGCGSNNNNPTPTAPPSGPTYTYPFSLFVGDYGSVGSGNGQLSNPEGIAVYNNALFVVDNGNNRVQKFDLSGNYLGQYTLIGASFLYGITVDKNGIIYVGDSGANTFAKFDANLNSLGG